jgi:hypothetical protein
MVVGPLRPRFRLFMNDIAPAAHVSAAQSRGFAHVHTWIFDLDNTLYPHEARVWPQVDERITLYIMQLFGLDGLSRGGCRSTSITATARPCAGSSKNTASTPTTSSTSRTTSTTRRSP